MASLLTWGVGLFLAAHGLVHLLYVALSRGWIEDDEAMGWNGRSWLLSRLLAEEAVLDLASGLYAIVTAGFVAGAVGLLLGAAWSTPLLVGAAVLSAAVIVLMWDGKPAGVVDKGLLGVVIDAVVVGWLLGA